MIILRSMDELSDHGRVLLLFGAGWLLIGVTSHPWVMFVPCTLAMVVAMIRRKEALVPLLRMLSLQAGAVGVISLAMGVGPRLLAPETYLPFTPDLYLATISSFLMMICVVAVPIVAGVWALLSAVELYQEIIE